MTAENHRDELLAAYGRFYGEQRFAVAFTASTVGEDAKRVTTREWDKTVPLADGAYGESYVAGRGVQKNPAIVLRPSNLVVLECDTEEDLVRIESLDLPETITVRSSKPYKRHYYFRPPAELEALPYVAFRFESGKLTADSGRYFLAPPSIHPSGAIYAFLPGRGPDDLPIATLPERVYRQLAQQAQRETSELKQQIQIDPEAKIRAGNRRDLIFRYACMLRRWGLSEAEIVQSAHAFNEQRCDPPVERHHVEIQVAGAMKKLGGQELAAAHTATADVFPDEPTDSWAPLNLNTLPDKPPVQPTLGGVGIVYPGKRHVFSGPQESAKTMAAHAIGIEVVRDGGTLILIDFEMGAWDTRDRLKRFGATSDDLNRVHYIEPSDPADDHTMERLLALHPTLVIVDAAAGAYDLQGLDDNKRLDVERFTRLYVRAFWRAGVATILLDHVVKNTELRGRYTIGSERKVGGADVHLGFDVITPIKRGGHGLFKISTHKDRGGFLKRGTLATFELTSDPDTHDLTWDFKASTEDTDTPFRPTTLMQRVSEYLELHPEGESKNQIEKNVEGDNTYIRKAINALIEDEYVTETIGPRKAKIITLKRSFRATSLDLAATSLKRTPDDLADFAAPYGGQATSENELSDPTSLDEQTALDDDIPF